MALALGSKIVTDDLAFFVDAANPRSYSGSGTTWYDLSKNGYNVTLNASGTPTFSNNTFIYNGQYSTASFDEGVLQQTNELGEWSIEVLFKQIGASNATEAIVAGRSGCHGGIYIYTDNTLRHAVKTNEVSCWTGAVNTSTVTMTNGEWYHSVMSYENGYIKHYVNGDLTGTTTFDRNTYTMTAYSDTFFIGGVTSRFPNIALSFVRCYKRALNDAEVKRNYNSAKVRMV